jgi:hypothetical protein
MADAARSSTDPIRRSALVAAATRILRQWRYLVRYHVRTRSPEGSAADLASVVEGPTSADVRSARG